MHILWPRVFWIKLKLDLNIKLVCYTVILLRHLRPKTNTAGYNKKSRRRNHAVLCLWNAALMLGYLILLNICISGEREERNQGCTSLEMSTVNEHTSKTFFLLDLSFVAQPIVAPRRSTATSGTMWLVLFCKEKNKIQVFTKLTARHSKNQEAFNKRCGCPWQLVTRGP